MGGKCKVSARATSYNISDYGGWEEQKSLHWGYQNVLCVNSRMRQSFRSPVSKQEDSMNPTGIYCKASKYRLSKCHYHSCIQHCCLVLWGFSHQWKCGSVFGISICTGGWLGPAGSIQDQMQWLTEHLEPCFSLTLAKTTQRRPVGWEDTCSLLYSLCGGCCWIYWSLHQKNM